MHTQIETAYAFKNNRLVHISDVTSGLNCGCVCVSCEAALVAKKGQINTHHFAHHAATSCAGAAETALHLLSKELFKELNNIVLPPYFISNKKVLKPGYVVIEHKELIAKGGDVLISEVSLEMTQNGFKPDITLTCNSKSLFVEIAVTNTVKRNKMRSIRRCNVPMIEIRLNLTDALLTREELRNKLQNHLASKHWLFHPKQRNAERLFYEKVRSAMRKARQPAMHTKPKQSSYLPLNVDTVYPKTIDSNVVLDRLQYEFFLKYNRQPTDLELSNIRFYLYGKNFESSYASIKGKRNS